MRSRAFWSVVVVCAVLPATARAQPDLTISPGIFHNYGYPTGPRVAPEWSYPRLTGGAFITYPPNLFPKHGKPDKSEQSDLVRYSLGSLDVMSNGFCLYGPRVPVYGPLPTLTDSPYLKRQNRTMDKVGLAGYGWHGLYNASPRPRFTTSVWSDLGSTDTAPPPAKSGGTTAPTTPNTPTAPAKPAAPIAPTAGTVPVEAEKGTGYLVVQVKVPHATAEVYVDGNRTVQSGINRVFESPPLESGTRYKYTVTVRWLDGGQVVELSQEVTGAPGDVVRLDFSR